MIVLDVGAGSRIQGSALPSDPDAAARVLWRLARPENDRVPREVCEALGIPGSPEPDVGVVAARLGISRNLSVLRAVVGRSLHLEGIGSRRRVQCRGSRGEWVGIRERRERREEATDA